MKMVKAGERYRHHKGKEYIIIAVGKHSETLEDMVVYQGQYNDPKFGNNPVWIRPKKMFTEKVVFNGKEVNRFELVGGKEN